MDREEFTKELDKRLKKILKDKDVNYTFVSKRTDLSYFGLGSYSRTHMIFYKQKEIKTFFGKKIKVEDEILRLIETYSGISCNDIIISHDSFTYDFYCKELKKEIEKLQKEKEKKLYEYQQKKMKNALDKIIIK